MAGTALDGARVRGRPAVEGCAGAGSVLSASRCACALAPTVISRAPVTTAASAVITMTVATLAMIIAGEPTGVRASARNSAAARAVRRSSRVRTPRRYPRPPRPVDTLTG